MEAGRVADAEDGPAPLDELRMGLLLESVDLFELRVCEELVWALGAGRVEDAEDGPAPLVELRMGLLLEDVDLFEFDFVTPGG